MIKRKGQIIRIKTLVFIGGLFCSGLLHSQSLFLMSGDSTFRAHKSFLQVNSSVAIRSTALDNSIMDRLAFGGVIDRDIKSNVIKGLSANNRLGGQANLGLSFFSLTDTIFNRPGLGLKLKVEERLDVMGTFGQNLFHLVMNGNDQFRDQRIGIGAYGEYYAFQKFGVGIFEKKTLSYVSVSLVNGQDFFKGQADGYLFTSELGDSLNLDYFADFVMSDTAQTGLGTGNGIGLALDARINFPLSEDKGFISMEVRDLGYVLWNEQTLFQGADSTLSYAGIPIEDLFSDSSGNFSVPNFLDSLNVFSEKEAYFDWLPFSMQVSMIHEVAGDDFFEAGIEIKPNRTHLPRLFLNYHYMMDQGTAVTASLNLGGYGKLRLGGGVQKYYKGWYARLWTDDIPGLVLHQLRGRGLTISAGKFFGKQ